MPKTYTPIDVTAVDAAFGGMVDQILPAYADVPDEFKRWGGTPWNKWVDAWFAKGLDRLPVARECIDLNLAMRNLRCVMGSWAPKHEHKVAGVAYLASLWFTSPDGKELEKAK